KLIPAWCDICRQTCPDIQFTVSGRFPKPWIFLQLQPKTGPGLIMDQYQFYQPRIEQRSIPTIPDRQFQIEGMTWRYFRAVHAGFEFKSIPQFPLDIIHATLILPAIIDAIVIIIVEVSPS